MKLSEHQIEFDRLLQSMPSEELAGELMRLASSHDASLEAVNNFAEFFDRVNVERCAGQIATASADINQD